MVALVLAVLSIITQQEELMKWHPIGVTRTRIRFIGVNVNEMLIKVKEIEAELARTSSYPSSS